MEERREGRKQREKVALAVVQVLTRNEHDVATEKYFV